jgi:SAM-dependent methyltransferase
VSKQLNLTQLADKNLTDKGNRRQGHRYTLLYEFFLFPYRNQPVSLLEMGLQIGGPEMNKPVDRQTTRMPSVQTWLEYFSNVHVTGLDVSDFSWFTDPRFTFVRCDMNERKNIKAAAETMFRRFDVIIDDASHASQHQQHGFLEFWPLLKPGGIYVIEDLMWQPPAYEKAGETKTRDLFRSYMETGEFTHRSKALQEEFQALRAEFGFVHLFNDQYRKDTKEVILVIQKLP